MKQLPLGIQLERESTFEGFFPGPNAEPLKHIAEATRCDSKAVVLLHSAAVTGKTHLLQAACRTVADENRTAGYFHFLDRENFSPAALAGWENLALVCLDEIDTVAGDAEWEQSVFNLFNGLYDNDGRLLMAARTPPTNWQFSLKDLSSRLVSGLVLQLRDMNDDEKVNALVLRALGRGLELSLEGANYLVKHYPRDMTTLCKLLDRLDEASMAAQRKLTLPFIRQVLPLA
ncbi:MAG: DnaA regulatory inactivator Hda [Gammaproteobacteria bacterium]